MNTNDAHDVLMEQAQLVCADNCGWYGDIDECDPDVGAPFLYVCPNCDSAAESPQGPSIGFDEKAIEQVMENTLRLVVQVNKLPQYHAWFNFGLMTYEAHVHNAKNRILDAKNLVVGDYIGIKYASVEDFDWKAARDLINDLSALLK